VEGTDGAPPGGTVRHSRDGGVRVGLDAAPIRTDQMQHLSEPVPRAGGMMQRIDHVLVGDFVLNRRTRRYASLILMIVAVLCGAANYTANGLFFFDRRFNLRPDMVSALISLAMILALYVRRVAPWSNSVYFYLSLVLNITVTAIFVQALLGEAAPFFLKWPMPFIVGTALAMTWFGMRPLAPVAWGVVLLLGFFNLQVAAEAMGLWGYLFIIAAMMGLILQIEVSVPTFIEEMRVDFLGPIHPAANGGTAVPPPSSMLGRSDV
jgi:hypothetical protein